MMQVKDLSFRYKGYPEILKDVSFDLEPGELLAILGNNGVGKSTLFKCILGLLSGYTGKAIVNGHATTPSMAACPPAAYSFSMVATPSG